MPLKHLPPHPSLDHLKGQARDLQKARQAADPQANQRIREFHPRFHRATDAQIGAAAFSLGDAQLVIAREYSFPSWAKLKASVARGDYVDPSVPYHERIPDPVFRRAVDAMDAGDEAGLRAVLTEHPELVRQRVFFEHGAYFGRPTLLAFVAENPIRHGAMPPNVVRIAKILLEAGADADDGTLELVASGKIPRESSAQIPLIDALCDAGARPGKAMGAALAHGEFAAAEALLRRGARENLPVAAALGRTEAARNLLAQASPEERHLALAYAAQFGRLEIVRTLLDAGEDPSRYNPVGAHSHSTPLHQAVCYRHLDVVRLLVERGARLDLKDTVYDGTPLGWARHLGFPDVEALLQEASSDASN